jgi:hypothetical protein
MSFTVAMGSLLPRSAEPRAHALGEDGHLLGQLTAVGGKELEDQVLDAAPGQLGDLVDQGGGLAREHAPGVGGRRRTLTGPEDPDVVAERECRNRRAAARLAESRQLGAAGPQLLRRAIDRMPGRAELGGTAERGPAVAADPDRRVRLLQGFGLEGEAVEPRVRPANDGARLVQSSCIARRCSSVMAPRSAKGTPSAALSAATQPAPIPRTTRPPLSASSEETILAVTRALR